MGSNISATITINDGFSSALSKLSSGLQRSGSAMDKLKGTLNGFKGTNQTLGKTSGMFKQFLGANILGAGITKGIGMIGSGISSMISELNASSTAWQTFNGNMKMIGRSPQQIAAVRGSLQKFAQQTIYSSSDMASAYAQFAAVGTKNSLGLVKGLGGLAAAADNPTQAMKTLMQQSVQAAAKPKLQWMDFKLMLEQTPAGMAAVAKSMHTNLNGLIKDIQAGKVSSKEFFQAVAKTGTNADFSKLATQYKTVGQAADGLKETLANKLQNAFDSTSKVGIKAISSLTDKIGNINFDKMIPGLVSFAKGLVSALTTAGRAVKDFFAGFANSSAVNSIKSMFQSIGNAIQNIGSKMNGFSGGNLAATLGGLAGKGIGMAANAISSIASALGKLSPGVITAIVAAFLGFKLIGPAITVAASAISGISTIFGALKTGLSFLTGIPALVAAAFSPIGGIILGTVAVIAAAIWAIKTNFMGIGDIFASIVPVIASAFNAITSVVGTIGNSIWQAFQPILPLVASLGKMVTTYLVTGIVTGVTAAAAAIAILADSFSLVIHSAMALKAAISGLVSGFKALGSGIKGIFTGNFSGVTKNLDNMKKSFSDAGNQLSKGFKFSNTREVLGQIGKIKDTLGQMGKTQKNIKVGVKPDTKGFKIPKMDAKAIKVPVKPEKMAKPAMPKMAPLKVKVAKPKIPQPARPKISPLKVKIQKPKIPAPAKPKMASLHVKVARPKVPQPAMPTGLKTIPAPKVGRPHVPQPTMPHLRAIPAPRVGRPSMAGVVGAVRSGMSAAASAARAGGAQISAAVRSGVNQAVAAARSAAGAMRGAGAMIGAGLAAGIRSQVGAVAAAADALVAQANRAARAAAKVHSPSRLFAEIGDYIGQGMALGINGTTGLVSNAGSNIANAAANGANLTSSLNTPTILTRQALSAPQATPTSTPFSDGMSPYTNVTNANNSYGGASKVNEYHFSFGDVRVAGGSGEETGAQLLAKIETELRKIDDGSMS